MRRPASSPVQVTGRRAGSAGLAFTALVADAPRCPPRQGLDDQAPAVQRCAVRPQLQKIEFCGGLDCASKAVLQAARLRLVRPATMSMMTSEDRRSRRICRRRGRRTSGKGRRDLLTHAALTLGPRRVVYPQLRGERLKGCLARSASAAHPTTCSRRHCSSAGLRWEQRLPPQSCRIKHGFSFGGRLNIQS